MGSVHTNRLARRRARARRWPRRALVTYRAVYPFIALRIPGPIVIMAAPIGVDREREYGNPEPGGVRIKWNVAALILVRNIRRVEPSSITVKGDVTPAPIIEATHHLDRCIRVELCHLGI